MVGAFAVVAAYAAAIGLVERSDALGDEVILYAVVIEGSAADTFE